MAMPEDDVWRVEAALKKVVGERAKELMNGRSRHLANLTPHEVARMPGGARVVLAELDKIALQIHRFDEA
jgi:hypothetical protein